MLLLQQRSRSKGSQPSSLRRVPVDGCPACHAAPAIRVHGNCKAPDETHRAGTQPYLHQVDATEEGDLANQFDVKGYPTLKWFVNGKEASDFGGGRTK